MLTLGCVIVILAVAYSSLREGLLTAACTLFNILFAGVVAFWFFEPIANQLEDLFKAGWFEGMEDAFALVGLFAVVFVPLKMVTGEWSGTVLDYPLMLDRIASGILGAIAGYLAAGFLVVVLQTLPWSPNFLGFDHRVDPTAPGAALRRILPPDRVWLATMNRLSEVPLAQTGQPAFDEDGSFSLRYHRHRRKGT